MIKRNRISRYPFAWIPTLYMAEGLPYFAVNTLAVILYTRMGIDLKTMTFHTSLLYLPWMIKPLWSPFVDIFSSKRKWILIMQLLVAICFTGIAIALPCSFFFQATLAVFWIMAFLSATHDIAADGFYMLALTHHEQAAYVGVRNTFYRVGSLIGQGGLVMLAGALEHNYGEISRAWSHTFFAMSAIFAFFFIYHLAALPTPQADKDSEPRSAADIFREFGATFSTFFRKKHIISALLFMLLYRFGEALMLKISVPFLLAPHADGGLQLSTAEVGFINGTVGVIALLAGGILGGGCIALAGLKKMLWPMALSLTIPSGVYCWLALCQPSSLIAISTAIGFEQFGYGFGFTAFMLYLIYFCEGEFKTSHYAFCTAFMAMGMMLPGMAAGWIFEWCSQIKIFNVSTPGFINYFTLVMLCSLITYSVCAIIKVAPDFGKSIRAKSRH